MNSKSLSGLLFFFLISGCATPRLFDWRKSNIETATERNPVARIVCIWEPSEGNGTDGLPTRGLAGQIMFFTNGQPEPVRVTGDVRVYLFDDHGTQEEQKKPIRQFDFLGDAWTVHLSESTLGPAYNVFVPYTRKHQWRAQCSLRVRLIPEAGSPIFSETVHVTLPGQKRPMGNNDIETTNNAVAKASWQRRDVSTIKLGAIRSRKRISHFNGHAEGNQLDHPGSEIGPFESLPINNVSANNERMLRRTPPITDSAEMVSAVGPDASDMDPSQRRHNESLFAELIQKTEREKSRPTRKTVPARRFRLSPAPK